MLDFEKLTINNKIIDFSLISSDREVITGKNGKLLILQGMDASTCQNQMAELTRLMAEVESFGIMFPHPTCHGQFELVNVDLETYQRVKDFSVRALTVN